MVHAHIDALEYLEQYYDLSFQVKARKRIGLTVQFAIRHTPSRMIIIGYRNRGINMAS